MHMKVLIVEDDLVTGILVETLLKDAGHTSCLATDSDSAQKLVELESFDALVSDWSVPGSLSGVEVAANFAKVNPKSPILFVTGHPRESLPAVDPSLSHASFRQKPVDYEEVVRELEKLTLHLQ